MNPDTAPVALAPAVSVREIFRRFWPYARPYRGRAALVLVASLLTPALDSAAVWMFKLAVDRVLVPRDFDAFFAIAGGYVALTLAGGGVGFVTTYLSTAISERFILAMRLAVFGHAQRLSVDFLDRSALGDLLSRVTSDVSAIEELMLSGLVELAVDLAGAVIFAGLLFYLEWRLALVSLLVAPLFWLAASRFATRLREVARERRRRAGALSAVVEESLGNAALVQAYGGEAREVERFRRQAEAGLGATLRTAWLRALYSPLVELLEVLSAMVVLGAGTYELSAGRLTLGGLLAFIAYVGKLFGPVRGVVSYATTVSTASAGAERIVELLDQKPGVDSGARALDAPRGAIAFEGVGFRYPDAPAPALDDVSFAIAPGETVALVGLSGAGKSTVLELLLRFHDPTAGRITLDGHDLKELDVASLRAAIAVVLQETLVFHGTVRDNIGYGKPGASDDEVRAAAVAADADEFIRALPDGYDSDVGERGRRLSGGERQRVAIARAMIRDAPVLLLDEAATGLDAASERRIGDALDRLRRGRATLLVTHDLRAARLADRIVVLDRGRVVEAGTHDALIARGERYAALARLGGA